MKFWLLRGSISTASQIIGKLHDKCGYLLETKVVSMIGEQERIVVKSKKVPSKSRHVKSMALMSQLVRILKLIEQLGRSTKNLRETGSSTTHVCVAKLLEKGSLCLGVSEDDASPWPFAFHLIPLDSGKKAIEEILILSNHKTMRIFLPCLQLEILHRS